MSTLERSPALPLDFNLPNETEEIQGRDGKTYLQFTTHMVTFYKQTYGEHSHFFMALRQARLIGSRCPKCLQVAVPAATWHCPACNFVEMEEVELGDRGVLAAQAPITIFPSASFIGQAPFCRGYVDVATDAPAASYLPSRLRTTTGLERPGIFVKGVELKLVFKDERAGSITDIFWVPVSELSREQLDKKPLLESHLNFATPKPPAVTVTEEARGELVQAIAAMRDLAAMAQESPRAQADLAGRAHVIGVKTGGGDFALFIKDRRMRIEEGIPRKPDLMIVAEDPKVFSAWGADGSLTDAAVEGALWLPDRNAFQLLPILDRLPRSTRRDMKQPNLLRR